MSQALLTAVKAVNAAGVTDQRRIIIRLVATPAAPPAGSRFDTAEPVRFSVIARRWLRPGNDAVST